MKRIHLLLLLICLLFGTSLAAAAPDQDADWNVISGGGGRSSLSIYCLDGTIGQVSAGKVSSGNLSLCSGFWCGSEDIYEEVENLYLPLISKD